MTESEKIINNYRDHLLGEKEWNEKKIKEFEADIAKFREKIKAMDKILERLEVL